VVSEQRLGLVASVCPHGTPNVSPRGTTAVYDDDGPRREEALRRYEPGDRMLREAGKRARAVVLVEVERALPLVSPGHDWIRSEEEMRARRWDCFEQLQAKRR
jgi:hypothetical protein